MTKERLTFTNYQGRDLEAQNSEKKRTFSQKKQRKEHLLMQKNIFE